MGLIFYNDSSSSLISGIIGGGGVSVALKNLTLSPSSAAAGQLYSGTITGKTAGSTITATSSDGTTLTVTGTALTGTFMTMPYKTITLTETLAGATNSPKSSIATINMIGSVLRQTMSNGNQLPFQVDAANTNNIRNNRHRKYIGGSATWTNIQIDWANWTDTPTAEVTTATALNVLKAGIEYNGNYYPVTFSGSSTVALSNGSSIRCDAISGLTLDPGVSREFYVDTHIEGPTTSVQYNRSCVTAAFLGEGTLAGTAAVDITDGSLARGAKATATVSGGNITAINLLAGGVNYNQNANVFAVEVGPNGFAFNKQIGTAQQTSGSVTGFTLTSGTPPTGLAAWSNPQIRIMYGNSKFTSTASAIAGFTSAMVTGIPSKPVDSVVFGGDSIIRGNGNALYPDLNSNQGIYEIGVANRCGTLNYAIGSSMATQWSTLNTTYPKLYALMQTANSTKGLMAVGTNDLANGGQTASATIPRINTAGNFFKNLGYITSFGCILPRATSTDNWATTANQTPVNAAFVAGADRDAIITALTNGTIDSQWGVKRSDTLSQDATTTQAWRVDLGTISSFRQTNEGVHPDYVLLGAASKDTAWQNQFTFIV